MTDTRDDRIRALANREGRSFKELKAAFLEVEEEICEEMGMNPLQLRRTLVIGRRMEDALEDALGEEGVERFERVVKCATQWPKGHRLREFFMGSPIVRQGLAALGVEPTSSVRWKCDR